jgi:hypothetical protein
VISVDLAQQLRLNGLIWTPTAGDRFVVPERGIDEDVFVVSDMTVEVHDLPSGRIIGFNGTTEWALDSLELPEVLWLPRESQLRELLGGLFVGLEAVPEGFCVVLRAGGADAESTHVRHVAAEAEDAYAAALLSVLVAASA